MKTVSEADDDESYIVDVIKLLETQFEFVRLFCSPSECSSTFQNFEGMVSVDTAHLKSVVQGQIFTMTAYDSNKHVTIIDFFVAKSEDAETWGWFLLKCLHLFP